MNPESWDVPAWFYHQPVELHFTSFTWYLHNCKKTLITPLYNTAAASWKNSLTELGKPPCYVHVMATEMTDAKLEPSHPLLSLRPCSSSYHLAVQKLYNVESWSSKQLRYGFHTSHRLTVLSSRAGHKGDSLVAAWRATWFFFHPFARWKPPVCLWVCEKEIECILNCWNHPLETFCPSQPHTHLRLNKQDVNLKTFTLSLSVSETLKALCFVPLTTNLIAYITNDCCNTCLKYLFSLFKHPLISMYENQVPVAWISLLIGSSMDPPQPKSIMCQNMFLWSDL